MIAVVAFAASWAFEDACLWALTFDIVHEDWSRTTSDIKVDTSGLIRKSHLPTEYLGELVVDQIVTDSTPGVVDVYGDSTLNSFAQTVRIINLEPFDFSRVDIVPTGFLGNRFFNILPNFMNN